MIQCFQTLQITHDARTSKRCWEYKKYITQSPPTPLPTVNQGFCQMVATFPLESFDATEQGRGGGSRPRGLNNTENWMWPKWVRGGGREGLGPLGAPGSPDSGRWKSEAGWILVWSLTARWGRETRMQLWHRRYWQVEKKKGKGWRNGSHIRQ